MVLYNQFLINLINSQRSSNIKAGVEFRHEDIFSKHFDDYCKISYEDYIKNQTDEIFLKDIEELDKSKISFGLVIKDFSRLSAQMAEQIVGRLRIYIFDPEESKISNNSYYYANEYAETKKELDNLINKIDLSEPNDLRKAKQIFLLLRKQYAHGFPEEEDILTGIRHSQNAYGCLCKHEAVCAGGANTFREMCILANIKCKKISIIINHSDKYEVGHALNQICINGEWGIVDIELEKETKPNDTSLFFCNEDTYKDRWKEHGCSYKIDPDSCPATPTNVSVSREYIDCMCFNEELSSARTFDESNELRTLAVTEISSGNITTDDMDRASLLEGKGEKEEINEHDSNK